jgi:hypothetical protein
MPLLGSAAITMWWDVAPDERAEFEHWHAHEHVPERLGIPGVRRGSRWASTTDAEGFFVMYELDSYETLTSPAYRTRLDNPTPWSVKMMPRHRNMVRSQCRIVLSHGGGIGGIVLTLRFAPLPGRGPALRAHVQAAVRCLPTLPGVTGAHLLETDTPKAEPTAEQRIRAGDAVADWIVLVSGYDSEAVRAVAADALATGALAAAGARPEQQVGFYRLACALTPQDL